MDRILEHLGSREKLDYYITLNYDEIADELVRLEDWKLLLLVQRFLLHPDQETYLEIKTELEGSGLDA